MYLFISFRFLRFLKKKVKNKAQVEGSICEAYIVEEMSYFANHFFNDNLSAQRMKFGRNEEWIDPNLVPFSIFNYSGRGHGPCKERYLDDNEYRAAQTYILRNCEEAQEIYQYVILSFMVVYIQSFCISSFITIQEDGLS